MPRILQLSQTLLAFCRLRHPPPLPRVLRGYAAVPHRPHHGRTAARLLRRRHGQSVDAAAKTRLFSAKGLSLGRGFRFHQGRFLRYETDRGRGKSFFFFFCWAAPPTTLLACYSTRCLFQVRITARHRRPTLLATVRVCSRDKLPHGAGGLVESKMLLGMGTEYIRNPRCRSLRSVRDGRYGPIKRDAKQT